MLIKLLVQTALTSLILGQIAPIAQRRTVFPAQVFLETAQNFATDMQLVQMHGMNYFLTAIQNVIQETESVVHTMLFLE